MATKKKVLDSQSAYDAYQSAQSSKPEAFTYDDTQLKSLYDQAMNRPDFSFDLNGNAFYNQYKDKFQKQGQLAMADTVGQVAAASGGYGNSYAQTAGQQVYQNNLDNLTDIVPELYNLAFQQYQYEGQQLQDLYGMASNERDVAYGQYRDQVADWQNERDTAYNIYADTRDYEYQQQRDSIADEQWLKEFNENVRQYDTSLAFDRERAAVADDQWAQEFGYQQQRDSIADSQWAQEFAESQRQYEASLAFDKEQAAISNAQWDKSYSLSQQELAEEIRANQASEAYNNSLLNAQYGDTSTSGGTLSFTSEAEKENAVNTIGATTATASADKLGSKAKTLYNALANPTYHYSDGSIKPTYAEAVLGAYERKEISAADAKFLLQTVKYID